MKTKTFIVLFVVALSILASPAPARSESEPGKILRYGDYGAVGDGVADDFDAIVKTHDAANKAGLPVRADAGANYYIGGADKTVRIQTDTDWGDARFIIDDTDVENRNRHVFTVVSALPQVRITSVESLRKNQEKIDLALPGDSFVVATDKTTMRYIRMGRNRNNGSVQTDVFVVDKAGNVDAKAPILWDFDTISSMTAYPIDPKPLTLRGGRFITVANRAESRYTYYSRGINVTRSNTVVDGIRHEITDELDHGAPYGGFLTISNCTNVTVQNCELSGHRTYVTTGSADLPVSMGSYDISVNRSVGVTFKNCKQLNDIHDAKLWGIFGSNYSKNIVFDTVQFSRFDAHMGVANATIRNSILGHQGINIIGGGVFLLEDTEVHGATMINLRSDYGSTFEGEFVISNCRFIPRHGAKSDTVLIGGSNSGRHDFGYTCSMPEKITIDGLVIEDVNPPNNYRGPRIFAAFNGEFKSEEYVEQYPYKITKELVLKNLTVRSGKPWRLSDNSFLFRNVRVTEP